MGVCESNLSVCNSTRDPCTSSVSNVDRKQFPKKDPMKFNHLYFAPGQTHNRRIGRNMREYGCVYNLKMMYPNNKMIEFKIDQARAVYGKGEFEIYGDVGYFDIDYESKNKTLHISVKYSENHNQNSKKNNINLWTKLRTANNHTEESVSRKEDKELLMTEKLEVAIELYNNAKQLELFDETDAAVAQYMNAAKIAGEAAVINASDDVFNVVVNVIEALIRCEDYDCAKTVINISKERFPGKMETLVEMESYTLVPELSAIYEIVPGDEEISEL